MDMYNIFDHGSAETYLIQGAETNPLLTSSLVGEIETMYNKGASEFVIDSGFYYPTASNYGYYCTGFDSPGEWDEHHQVFSLDGPDAQYTDVQTENLPYVYYTPTYGYAESPYNPYNPYIPGAMLGFDGSYVGTQQLYAIPSYHTPVSSPAYYPIVDQSQSRLDIIPHASPDPLLDTSMATSGRSNGVGFRHNLSTPSTAFAMMSSRPAPNQTHSLGGVTEVRRTNVGPGKQSLAQGSVIASTYPGAASTPVLQGKRISGSIQVTDNMPNGRVLSQNNKVSLPSRNDFSSLGLAAAERATAEKLHSRSHYDKPFSVSTGNVDTTIEQNRGPRMSRRSKQLAVKAYTTRAGDINSQGEIIINADQYNNNDFPLDYANSKFFVIKSYSEDDVHKSIKYNVWSSTPNGNRKLDIAYEDAQRLSAGCSRACPVFLFFSVNASGQFCGVAEMLGAVDFHRDMDFWQQDKWNGSFPVRWHFIKDVPNNNFRHIILENNENKPVTNSRDTQEILYKQGLEMLKIFKSYASRTSLLDDFMYYESRQKIMHEEKTRLLINSYERPLFISGVDPPRKLNCGFGSTPASIRSLEKTSDTVDTELRKEAAAPDRVSSITEATIKTSSSEETGNHIDTKTKADGVSTLKIGSLAIDPKKLESEQSNGDGGATEQVGGVVKVGSMAVRVNGFSASSGGFLTVGSIPLDPRSLKAGKEEALSAKGGSQPQGG